MRTYSTVRRLVRRHARAPASRPSVPTCLRLASRGHRVGLLTPMHGPSLPTQIPGLTDRIGAEQRRGGRSLQYEGVKLMSWMVCTHMGVVDERCAAMPRHLSRACAYDRVGRARLPSSTRRQGRAKAARDCDAHPARSARGKDTITPASVDACELHAHAARRAHLGDVENMSTLT